MTAYYNEIDPFAAAWLRQLIAAEHIAPGDVDERSIEDVKPDELRPYTQCHFFAGIGIWSYALRLARWDDSRPVWTGSCPCQPFSAAGKGDGFDDERHLWPAWFHLIEHAKPRGVPIFGEQVASPDGLAWLDLVQADLENAYHTLWPFDLCAAGFGAPHIRQRLYFVAEPEGQRYRARNIRGQDGAQRTFEVGGTNQGMRISEPSDPSKLGELADTGCLSERGSAGCGERGNAAFKGKSGYSYGPGNASGIMADSDGRNASAARIQSSGQHRQQQENSGSMRGRSFGIGHNGGPEVEGAGPVNSHWRDSDWLFCRDGKFRPVKSGTFPLAHGTPASMGALSPALQRLAEVAGLSKDSLKRAKSYRVGSLRGFGNGIVAEQAAAFITAYDGVTA